MTMTTRHRLTDAEIEAQQAGGRYLEPGVWVDRAGCLHFCVPELLEMVGLLNTPAHVDWVVDTIRREFAAHSPETEIVEQGD